MSRPLLVHCLLTQTGCLSLADRADTLYDPLRIPKKADEFREVYRVLEPLRSVQQRIVHCFIDRVQYPPYLQGGIKDSQVPRNDIVNASFHTNQRRIVKLDIEEFFPSVKAPIILDTWKRLFRFSDERGGYSSYPTYNLLGLSATGCVYEHMDWRT